MKSINQIVSSIIANQKKYEKAKKSREKSFEAALKWQSKRYERSQKKTLSVIDSATNPGQKINHPSTCVHEHCVWWKRQIIFKDFKDSIKKDLKEQKKKKLKDLDIDTDLLN